MAVTVGWSLLRWNFKWMQAGAVLAMYFAIKMVRPQTACRPLRKPIPLLKRNVFTLQEQTCLEVIWVAGKLRLYLCGPQFNIVTADYGLCWLTTSKDTSRHLGRWKLRVQEFDATVRYKSDRNQRDTDAPSWFSKAPTITQVRERRIPFGHLLIRNER